MSWCTFGLLKEGNEGNDRHGAPSDCSVNIRIWRQNQEKSYEQVLTVSLLCRIAWSIAEGHGDRNGRSASKAEGCQEALEELNSCASLLILADLHCSISVSTPSNHCVVIFLCGHVSIVTLSYFCVDTFPSLRYHITFMWRHHPIITLST